MTISNNHNLFMKLLAVFIITILTAGAGQAEARTFKMATLAPNGSTWMTEMKKAADEISKATNNRVNFKFYAGGIMGSTKSVLKKIRINQLQGGAFTTGELTDIHPDIILYNLPFLFRSYDEVEYVRNKLDSLIAKEMEEIGMIMLGISSGGFAYFMSDTPIASVDELRHKKVWLPEGDIVVQTVYANLGIAPVPLSLADVYTGLQTGLIDTIGTSPIGAIAFQWHTRLKYATNLPLVYLTGMLTIDKKAFYKISKADQAIVLKLMNEAMHNLNEITKQDDQKAREALIEQGIKFVAVTPKEQQRVEEIAGESVADLREKGLLKKETYDLLQKHLSEFRSRNDMPENAKKP
jgi:TRAP-type C4-dicarboxylate transport system substrate-binding protein